MRRYFIYAALSFLLAVSCDKEPGRGSSAETDEIVFCAPGYTAEVVTKATSAVSSLTSFDVLCVTGSAGADEVAVWNGTFSGTTVFTGGRFWPESDLGFKFYAANVAMDAAKTGPSVTVDNGTDVVCAVCLNPVFRSSNNLTFEHVFARLGFCDISTPTDYEVKNLTVSLVPRTGGRYDLYKGMGKHDGTGWTSVVEGSSTIICTQAGSTADIGLYLVPGEYTITLSYTKAKGDFSVSETKTGVVALVGGKINNITAAIPGGGEEEIGLRIVLAEWESNEETLHLS